ncbi:YdeI/OmpD-associated family protein [Candidatus Nomurabacteria bacterium]|nr:YdeI/OmpD-associated family protein [Candidatus Kaiserbacteria bacterium]MCB9815412.1 YdeI/OmpD-associated family protein [Candidatus Nomurabacteria bacterium]
MTKQKADMEFRHRLPADMKSVLNKNKQVLELWEKLTPLARNEWICWVTIVKKKETREEHLIRLCEDLKKGKRRPCCWPGCPHRRESAKKWFDRSK